METPRTLNEQAAAKLIELRGLGIEPTPDEIVWLHELGKRVADVMGEVDRDLLALPFRAGNVLLYPITIAAEIWLDGVASRCLPETAEYNNAMLYALAHGKQETAFDGLHDAPSIRAAVRTWLRTVTATRAELIHAASKALRLEDSVPNHDRPGLTDDKVTWAEYLSRVQEEVGGDLKDWLWKTSACGVAALLRASVLRRCETNSGDGEHPALVKAIDRLQKAFAAIVEAHKEPAHE